MWIAVVFSVLVGAAIVVQNGMQAQLMRSANLWLLLVVGNLLAALACLVIFLGQRERGGVVEELGKIPLLVLIPGICGVVITAGMPWAIARIGVFSTVMIVIGCQILASLAWDWFGAGAVPNGGRLLGALLVVVGVILVLRQPG